MSKGETLLTLIQEQSTVRDFSSFLKSRGLAGGATWSDLHDRARSALQNNRLSEKDLSEFLSEAEEYGRQHVFLYRVKGIPILPSRRKIESWLQQHGALGTLAEAQVVEKPNEPMIAEVRRDPAKGGDVFVIKIVETRTYDAFLGIEELGGGRYSRQYQREEVRAVNVIRVHSDGILEIRIFSHRGGSTDYGKQLAEIWTLIGDLVKPTEALPLSLVKAKKHLYESRHGLEDTVSFSSTLLRNSAGVNVTAACGRQQSLFSDDATDAGLQTMTTKGEAYCDEHNLWWLKQKKGRPTQDIHVMMAGEPNEFAVPQQCSRADYEHVLSEIRRFNR